jgi:uroporphyrinogen-III decarboxylase
MMPFQTFLELCATELDLLLELSEECMQRTLRVLDVLLAERSVDYVFIGGCEWLTPPMGSPRLYEQLVQRFEAPLIARAHQGGAVVHVHSHGKVRSTLEMVVQRGADFFEPVEPPPDGDISFAEAKALVRGRMTLGGNIEARIIELGEADEVEQAVRNAFAGGKERMVLKPTSEPIRTLTPRMMDNYHRLVDVWKDLSPL